MYRRAGATRPTFRFRLARLRPMKFIDESKIEIFAGNGGNGTANSGGGGGGCDGNTGGNGGSGVVIIRYPIVGGVFF